MIPLITYASESKVKVVVLRASAEGQLPDSGSVLPLVIQELNSVRPYVPGDVLRPNTEVVVAEFAPKEPLPFAPPEPEPNRKR
jgi:hypothetical protein